MVALGHDNAAAYNASTSMLLDIQKILGFFRETSAMGEWMEFTKNAIAGKHSVKASLKTTGYVQSKEMYNGNPLSATEGWYTKQW